MTTATIGERRETLEMLLAKTTDHPSEANATYHKALGALEALESKRRDDTYDWDGDFGSAFECAVWDKYGDDDYISFKDSLLIKSYDSAIREGKTIEEARKEAIFHSGIRDVVLLPFTLTWWLIKLAAKLFIPVCVVLIALWIFF